MHVITVANTKGGVGKSTFTINFALYLLSRKKQVRVFDADPQGTITEWVTIRNYVRGSKKDMPNLIVEKISAQELIKAVKKNKEQNFLLLYIVLTYGK